MLTFIRIHLPDLRPTHPGMLRRMRALGTRKPADSKSPAQPNPWHCELERLQRGLRSDTDQVRFGVTASSTPSQPAPPPPPPLPLAQPANKQGTLTDLKIWWGKATIYKSPDPQELAKFAPAQSRKRNRWMQF